MQQLTGLKMGIKDFPYFTYKEVDAWMADGVRMLHMTHTGEMGWVMYIPNEVSEKTAILHNLAAKDSGKARNS